MGMHQVKALLGKPPAAELLDALVVMFTPEARRQRQTHHAHTLPTVDLQWNRPGPQRGLWILVRIRQLPGLILRAEHGDLPLIAKLLR